MSEILFFSLALIAEIIGTVGGFGSSMLFVPLAGFFLPFHQVLGLTALFHVFSNIAKLMMFYKHMQWKTLIQIGIPSIIFVIIGAWMSKYISGEIGTLLLGIFCVGFSTFFFIRSTFTIKASSTNMIASGVLSGWLAGIIGTGGAIRGMALTALNLEKSIYIATSAGIDFGVDASRTVMYATQGYMQGLNYRYIIGLIGVAFLGSYLGKLIVKRISQERFRQIVLGFIFLTGIIMLYKYYIGTIA